MSVQDHFCSVSATYAAARPEYPDALSGLLARHAPAFPPRDAPCQRPGPPAGPRGRGPGYTSRAGSPAR